MGGEWVLGDRNCLEHLAIPSPTQQAKFFPFSKAAPAESSSPWKPLRSLKVQKKWKRRTVL